MVMWYWSADALFWQVSINHVTSLIKSWAPMAVEILPTKLEIWVPSSSGNIRNYSKCREGFYIYIYSTFSAHMNFMNFSWTLKTCQKLAGGREVEIFSNGAK